MVKRRMKNTVSKTFIGISTFSLAVFLIAGFVLLYDYITEHITTILLITGAVTVFSLVLGIITWKGFKQSVKNKF